MSHDQTTLLLADDDTTILDSLAPFLERAGFVVVLASDGETALGRTVRLRVIWGRSAGGPAGWVMQPC